MGGRGGGKIRREGMEWVNEENARRDNLLGAQIETKNMRASEKKRNPRSKNEKKPSFLASPLQHLVRISSELQLAVQPH